MRKVLRDEQLIDPTEAVQLAISRLPVKLPVSEVSIIDAIGKRSAEEVESPIDLPPFSRSTVDGYAIRSSDVPGKLRLMGKLNIGEEPSVTLPPGQCIEVDTGSALPPGADAVVKVEDVRKTSEFVEVTSSVSPGLNVAWMGSDLVQGEPILSQGEQITSEKIATLAAAGISTIKVVEGLKVAVITTGNELVPPGSPLPPAHVYESNGWYLAARLKELGHEVLGPTMVRDNYEEILNAISEAVDRSDLVLVTGGTSAGERDYVHAALSSLGEVVFHGLRFKPGKPTVMAIVRGKPVFGLPGNPASTVMVFDRIVNKYLSQGGWDEPLTITAVLAAPVMADPRRFTYVPVYAFRSTSTTFVYPIIFDSHMIGTLSSSDGYLALPPGTRLEAGSVVEVRLLKVDPRPVVLGEEERSLSLSNNVRKLLVGSRPACDALRMGFGDVLIVSSLLCQPDSYQYSMTRTLFWSGRGVEVGYVDWVGMSSLTKTAHVKVKSPSIALKFLNRGRVLLPSTYHAGEEEVGEETLYVVVRNNSRKFLEGIK
ncbi:molybdopterin molybdenumtransferase MoeA [Sulfodiicoccus acidiphilus]|uniref:Molybdopterin molybdenumtransferase MoeA n=1 Tax=Sulfodiicoccus acidiphilus TaxID=1670455 RepID=A0A348B416_9CREN|nr:molybdopterin-binding protein [Sulfodiicoccus acidiphilus]BBD72918.1 molybdopterin molybdenumtransferase MoeA [Sulfodiicoccus acidiphilus]GGT88012.1 molybdopterin molybdenumtransferase MoeA [Sulfodiicoccus acidiphilus]